MMWTISLEGGPRRVNHAAVALGDRIFSFGGYCSGEVMDPDSPIDIHVLNTNTYRWQLVTATNATFLKIDEDSSDDEHHEGSFAERKLPDSPYQRYGHTVCAYNGKAYLWGGRNDEYGASQHLHEFDPETLSWKYIPALGNIPPARDGHSCVVVGDKMFLFGGFEEEQQRFSQETYVFDFSNNRWTEILTSGSPPVWRDFHTAVELDSKMYVFGGRSDQMGQYHSTRDLYCDRLKVLDLKTFEWSDPIVNGTKPCGRRSHSTWAYNGKMFLFGGYLGTRNRHFDDLYSFDPTNNTWTQHFPVTLVESPSARRRQCTVVVGDKVFLFGGTTPVPGANGGLSDLADLYVLDYSPSLFNLASRSVINQFHSDKLQNILPMHIKIRCLVQALFKINRQKEILDLVKAQIPNEDIENLPHCCRYAWAMLNEDEANGWIIVDELSTDTSLLSLEDKECDAVSNDEEEYEMV